MLCACSTQDAVLTNMYVLITGMLQQTFSLDHMATQVSRQDMYPMMQYLYFIVYNQYLLPKVRKWAAPVCVACFRETPDTTTFGIKYLSIMLHYHISLSVSVSYSLLVQFFMLVYQNVA